MQMVIWNGFILKSGTAKETSSMPNDACCRFHKLHVSIRDARVMPIYIYLKLDPVSAWKK